MSEQLQSIEKLNDLNKQLKNSLDQKAVDDAIQSAKKTIEAKFKQDEKILIEELEKIFTTTASSISTIYYSSEEMYLVNTR